MAKNSNSGNNQKPAQHAVSLDRMAKTLAQKPTELPGWVYAKGGMPKVK